MITEMENSLPYTMLEWLLSAFVLSLLPRRDDIIWRHDIDLSVITDYKCILDSSTGRSPMHSLSDHPFLPISSMEERMWARKNIPKWNVAKRKPSGLLFVQKSTIYSNPVMSQFLAEYWSTASSFEHFTHNFHPWVIGEALCRVSDYICAKTSF